MLWAKLSHNPGGVPGILSGTRVIAQDETVDFHRWKPRISSFFFLKNPTGVKMTCKKKKSPIKEEQQHFLPGGQQIHPLLVANCTNMEISTKDKTLFFVFGGICV